MGEGFISRRGGESYTLPVLSASYPKDVSTAMSSGGTVSFSISITEHGKPAEYTYQWYKNGQAVSGANGIQYIASSTSAGTFTVYCEVTNKAGTVTSRVATATIYNAIPTSDCWSGGTAQLVKENAYDWHLICLSSVTLTLPRDTKVDLFLCGGGGKGGKATDKGGGGGGGGGYTSTKKGITLTGGKSYSVVVGSGGGKSWAFDSSAYSVNPGGNGGNAPTNVNGGSGGSGTGRGGDGGSQGGGGTGADGVLPFGVSYGSSYHSWKFGAGGGGGSGVSAWGSAAGGKTGGGDDSAGLANSGGGGAGGSAGWGSGYSGGSGIVIIRNAR